MCADQINQRPVLDIFVLYLRNNNSVSLLLHLQITLISLKM